MIIFEDHLNMVLKLDRTSTVKASYGDVLDESSVSWRLHTQPLLLVRRQKQIDRAMSATQTQTAQHGKHLSLLNSYYTG